MRFWPASDPEHPRRASSTPPNLPSDAFQGGTVIDLTASRSNRRPAKTRKPAAGDGSGNLAPTLKKGGHIVPGDFVIGLGRITEVQRTHRPGLDLRLVSSDGSMLVGLYEDVNVLLFNAA